MISTHVTDGRPSFLMQADLFWLEDSRRIDPKRRTEIGQFGRSAPRGPIALLEQLAKEYSLLLEAAGLTDVVPVIRYDWKAPFRIPWI